MVLYICGKCNNKFSQIGPFTPFNISNADYL